MRKQEQVYCTAGEHLIAPEDWRSQHNMCRTCYDDVSGEAEARERRVLFIHAMRQPEMRLLYKALWHLKWDKGVDLASIQSLEMERYGMFGDCWLLLTDRWLVTTLQANKLDLSIDDFLAFRLHDDTDPLCDCSGCREALMCHLSCKAYYVALMERERGVQDA